MEPLSYRTPMIDPYRLTLSQNAAASIIRRPTTVISDPYDARAALLDAGTRMTVPQTGATNVVNPTLSQPGANTVPQPATNDGNTGIVPPPISDPAVTTTTTDTASPKWLQWVKEHPLESAGIALAAYYIGKEIFKPKKSR